MHIIWASFYLCTENDVLCFPDETEEKGKKDKGADKLKPPPRIHGLRDANKKQVKIVSMLPRLNYCVNPFD